MNVNGFEAWIAVDDTPLTQYNVETDSTSNSATSWIPSEVGKAFSVNWKRLVQSSGSEAGWVKLDGESAKGAIIPESGSASVSYVTTSPTHYKPILFSSLDSTDDDVYLHSDSSKHLGEITLEIWSIKFGESKTRRHSSRNIGVEKVHERSKKAIEHQIKLGDEQSHEYPRDKARSVTKVALLATFTFKYRSIDLLRANGIAPPEPQVGEKRKASDRDAETPESDDEDIEAEELKVLSQELRALGDKINEIQSRRAKKKRSSKKVKTEDRPVVRSTEVIDLTSDE